MPSQTTIRLGHATINITLDTYSHVVTGLHEEAAEQVAALLRAPVGIRQQIAPEALRICTLVRKVVVSADLDRVRVICDGSLVADHDRVWAKHHTISDPAHLVAAKVLRRGQIDLVRSSFQTEVEIRSLAAYDTVLGIALGAEGRMG